MAVRQYVESLFIVIWEAKTKPQQNKLRLCYILIYKYNIHVQLY